VTVNGIKYPNYNYDLNFGEKKMVMAHSDAFTFDEKYYGTNELVCQSGLSLLEYKNLFPLFFVDISKQKERVVSETAELVVNLKFRTAVPDSTVIFAVIISDKLLQFVSDGTQHERCLLDQKNSHEFLTKKIDLKKFFLFKK
jgi:hypothetical protein